MSAHPDHAGTALCRPVLWGLVPGAVQVATPLAFLRQHRTHFVGTTRRWPPFCLAVAWVVAVALVVLLLAGR